MMPRALQQDVREKLRERNILIFYVFHQHSKEDISFLFFLMVSHLAILKFLKKKTAEKDSIQILGGKRLSRWSELEFANRFQERREKKMSLI